jgi:hypothetical protein
VLATLGPIYALSYGTTAWILGRSTLRAPAGWIVAFLVGWAILLVAALTPILSGLVWFAAVVFGLGALVVASWRAAQPLGLPRPPPEPLTHQWRLVSVVWVRFSSDVSWSATAGPEIPTRVASSWAAKATPTNSAIPVRLAHSNKAITAVSGP